MEKERGTLSNHSLKLYDATWNAWQEVLRSNKDMTADELLTQLISTAGPETHTDMVFAEITRRITPHLDAIVNELKSAYSAAQDAVLLESQKYDEAMAGRDASIAALRKQNNDLNNSLKSIQENAEKEKAEAMAEAEGKLKEAAELMEKAQNIQAAAKAQAESAEKTSSNAREQIARYQANEEKMEKLINAVRSDKEKLQQDLAAAREETVRLNRQILDQKELLDELAKLKQEYALMQFKYDSLNDNYVKSEAELGKLKTVHDDLFQRYIELSSNLSRQ